MEEYLKAQCEKIIALAAKTGIVVSAAQAEALAAYMQMVIDNNTRVNLTAITEPDAFIEKHIVDSLAALPFIKGEGARVIDVGTGGGFPGIVLAVMLPDDHFTLLDSTAKKLAAVEHMAGRLGLTNVTCVHARAEEAARLPAFRDRFDYAVSRAVAALPVLAELSLPFVKPGGALLAFKGKGFEAEVTAAATLIEKLGGEAARAEVMALPDSGETRALIIIEKKNATPKAYPRSYARMKKEQRS